MTDEVRFFFLFSSAIPVLKVFQFLKAGSLCLMREILNEYIISDTQKLRTAAEEKGNFFDHKISLMVHCVRSIRVGWMYNFPPYLEFNY